MQNNIDIDENDFQLNSYELKILRKIFDWPKVVETAANKYEPHRIPFNKMIKLTKNLLRNMELMIRNINLF